MYFKFFTLGINTENDILRAGFHVNSYEERNVYSGSENEFVIHTPKDYRFNNEIWIEIDSSILDERSCCLARTPFLSEQELWDLFVQSDNDDDRMGALVLLYNNHISFLLEKQKVLYKMTDPSKEHKRALRDSSRIL